MHEQRNRYARKPLEIRVELNQVLGELGMGTLLSDWTKLENLVKLLEPFAIHTDQPQGSSFADQAQRGRSAPALR